MFLYSSVVEEYYFHKIDSCNDTSKPCKCFMLICPWSVAIVTAM
jgi:hypothetical protein